MLELKSVVMLILFFRIQTKKNLENFYFPFFLFNIDIFKNDSLHRELIDISSNHNLLYKLL